MSKSVHLTFLIITAFSLLATVIAFLLRGEVNSILTMLKVFLPILVGILAVFFVTRRFVLNGGS